MGQVTFKLEGDEAGFVRACLNARQKVKDLENGISNAGRKTDKLDSGFRGFAGNAAGKIASLALNWMSVTKAIQLANLAQEKHWEERNKKANATTTFEDSMTNLLSLGNNSKKAKAVRESVWNFADKHAIDEKEVAAGRYTLRSMTAWADNQPGKREAMMEQIGLQRRVMNVPMADLATVQAKMGAFYQNESARKLSNLSMYGLEKGAVRDPQELANVMPVMMAAGKVGNLDATQATALGAYITSKTGTAAKAGGAMDILTRKIMLSAPDEQEAIRQIAGGFGKGDSKIAGRMKLLKEAGVKEEDNALERFYKLGELNKKKEFSAQQLKDLFGERGLKHGKGLFSDTEGLKRMVKDFYANTGNNRDLAREKLNEELKDKTRLAVENKRRTEIQKRRSQQTPKAVESQTYEEFRDTQQNKEGSSGFEKTINNWIDNRLRWLSGDDLGGQYGELYKNHKGTQEDRRIFDQQLADVQMQNEASANLLEASKETKEAAKENRAAAATLKSTARTINPDAQTEGAP